MSENANRILKAADELEKDAAIVHTQVTELKALVATLREQVDAGGDGITEEFLGEIATRLENVDLALDSATGVPNSDAGPITPGDDDDSGAP